MNTNAVFNLKRFGNLVAYDLKLNGFKYVLSIVAFALMLFFWLNYQMHQSPHQFMSRGVNPVMDTIYYYTNTDGYVAAFFMGLVGLGVFIGMSFTRWGNKIRRVSFLQLPASTFEKYLHPFLVRFVGGTLLFFVIFWIVAQLACLSFNKEMSSVSQNTYYTQQMMTATSPSVVNTAGQTNQVKEIKPESFNYSMLVDGSQKKEMKYFVVSMTFLILSIAAFLFVVPLFFRKQALLKTIVLIFAFIFLIIATMILFSHLFYPIETHGLNIELEDVQLTDNWSSVEIALSLFSSFSWAFFLLIGYFKLKEMKI